MENKETDNYWTNIISSKRSLFNINFKEIWNYKDLILMFIKRDFVSVYKQTILGPLWFFIQPLFTTLIFTVIFGNIAKISTNGIPHTLFYLAGITCWNYFADTLNNISNTFLTNQHVFGKVYFPRLIVPISVVISNLLKFTIQFLLFLGFYFYFFFKGNSLTPNKILFLLPYLIFLMGVVSLGFGILLSSMTTKYRDLKFLLQFSVQLWMYATPIIYPFSTIPEKYKFLALFNPMTPIVEAFRFGFFGKGFFEWQAIGITTIVSFGVLFIGILIFNKTEQNFMDTI